MWRTLCVACQRLQSEAICENCWRQLTPLPEMQGRLKLQLQNAHCLPHVAYSAYEAPLKHWLYKLKYESQKNIAYALGKYLGQWFSSLWPSPQFIVPIPLHPGRFQERGYNQSHVLAQGMSETLHAKVCPILLRLKETPALHRLSAEERQSILKNAFCLKENLPVAYQGAAILIVDDIFTTGNTIRSAANCLLPLTHRLVSISLALTLPEPYFKSKV